MYEDRTHNYDLVYTLPPVTSFLTMCRL